MRGTSLSADMDVILATVEPTLSIRDIHFLMDQYLCVLNYLFFPFLLLQLISFILNICRCDLEDILLEMDRILRPEGAVIFRDEVDVLIKVNKIVRGMRWDTKMVDHEDGPLVPEKVLVAVKQYWVGNSTSTQ